MVLRIAAIATVQQALTAGNTITHEEGTALALRTPARKVAPMAEQSALTVPQEPSRMRQQVRAAAVLRENQQDNPPPRQDPKSPENEILEILRAGHNQYLRLRSSCGNIFCGKILVPVNDRVFAKNVSQIFPTNSPTNGGLQIPRWLGSDPLSAWWLGLAPATLEFWVRFPNERNQGKQAHPV